jgi:hypothetical protein
MPLQGGPGDPASGVALLTPGLRISLAEWLAARTEIRRMPAAERSNAPEAKPCWQRLSLAVGAQFHERSAREFEWALETGVKQNI